MEKLYEGKSKIVYSSEEPGTCIIKYKDTATAGNGVKKEDLPGKGKLNAEISNIIFDYLMKNGVKTHLIKVIDETTVLAKKAEIVMVEVIVRNIAAGSFSKKYGVPEGSPLKNTVVEFSYKSDELGDPMINDSQITAIGLATQEELDELRAMSKRINELMVELFAKGGVRLVDGILRFGRDVVFVNEPRLPLAHKTRAQHPPQQTKGRVGHAVGAVLPGLLMVVEHPKADIVHDAVKIVRYGKAAGDLDIRAQNLQ